MGHPLGMGRSHFVVSTSPENKIEAWIHLFCLQNHLVWGMPQAFPVSRRLIPQTLFFLMWMICCRYMSTSYSLLIPSSCSVRRFALASRCSSRPRRDLFLGDGGEGGLGVAEEFSSSLGGKGGATLACSIISVRGTCLAGASPRCPSACKQEIQPNSMTKWMKIDKTGLNG